MVSTHDLPPMSPQMEEARQALLTDDPDARRRGVVMVEQCHTDGDPLAAYALATWRLFGVHGYEQNEAEAAGLLQYAADRGVADAAYDLAVYLERSKAGARPLKDAFGYYVLAAVQGDPEAKEELVRCFYWGIGTFRNRSVAEKLQDLIEGAGPQAMAAE